MTTPRLQIDQLSVRYPGRNGSAAIEAVNNVSLSVQPGETFALVGESGCGKTALALATIHLEEPGEITHGKILLDGRDLTSLSEKEWCKIRGKEIGMVFQEPSAAMNPVMKIGHQVGESLRVHERLSKKQAFKEAVQLLGEVSLPNPERMANAYPHELSGGMLQRVMWATALACRPKLILADEPTTALDATLQVQMMDWVESLREQFELTMLLITHDVGVVVRLADRVGTMYSSHLVEHAHKRDWIQAPAHPYSKGLLESVPGYKASQQPGSKHLKTLPGSVPDPTQPPPGCRFHPRCPERFEPCDHKKPPLIPLHNQREVACHLWSEGKRS